jgi:hypothetical protein
MRKAPIDSEAFIDEFDLCDNTSFLGPIADYISPDCERKVDFGELVALLRMVAGDTFTTSYAEDASENPEAFIIFGKGFKEAYFREQLKSFKKLADSMNLYEFMSGTHQTWLVEETISERFGYYIYDENEYPMRLDSFLRDMPNDKETKYWLGATLNYHYYSISPKD